MKSTYKLFGTYWDGRHSDNNGIAKTVRLSSNNSLNNVISFKELLAVETQNDFDDIISSIELGFPVAIKVDYWPESSNPVLCAFLQKRLYQMIAHLSEFCPEVQCI